MIDPSLIVFLQALAQNNDRDWFQAHKREYQSLNKTFTDYMSMVAEQIAHFDVEIQNRLGEPKLVKVFRIYRDTRFSKDKTSYKTNFSSAIAANHGPGQPCYYLSIEPGNSFAGGGVFMPPAESLQAIREKIDEKYQDLEDILDSSPFKSIFPHGLDRQAALKTAPRGYSIDHPAIDLLRLKSFVTSRNFSDAEITSSTFTDKLIETYEAISQLNAYFQALE